MRGCQVIALLGAALFVQATLAQRNHHGAEIEDNEFAEFEEFDEDDEAGTTKEATGSSEPKKEDVKKVVMAPQADVDSEQADEDDATVEEEEEDFDEEEFEGFDRDSQRAPRTKGHDKPPDLKITKIPVHLRTNWDSFYMEMLMLAGLGVYFLNFLHGKSKNYRLAQAWFNSHKDLLEGNFHVVGDDGSSQEISTGQGELIKESESVYSLWCSGRVCCEGMLVTLKLLKRQDLVSSVSRMFRPTSDQIVVRVEMEKEEMDTFVMCLAHKRVCGKLQKEMADLSLFCPEKKGAERYDLPPNFQLLSEIGEATSAVFDKTVCTALKRYDTYIEYMHFSDQYTGIKSQDENQSAKPADIKKVLLFSFNVPGRGNCSAKDMESMRPLMQLVFYCVDKVKRVRLSKEGKQKAEKNRQKVEETMLKASHAQRAEAAQARREEKMRAEKERMMNEEDPDKQRKWEEKKSRMEMKKKQPKVKMMKVKAM